MQMLVWEFARWMIIYAKQSLLVSIQDADLLLKSIYIWWWWWIMVQFKNVQRCAGLCELESIKMKTCLTALLQYIMLYSSDIFGNFTFISYVPCHMYFKLWCKLFLVFFYAVQQLVMGLMDTVMHLVPSVIWVTWLIDGLYKRKPETTSDNTQITAR